MERFQNKREVFKALRRSYIEALELKHERERLQYYQKMQGYRTEEEEARKKNGVLNKDAPGDFEFINTE
jgi:hypothetical protein